MTAWLSFLPIIILLIIFFGLGKLLTKIRIWKPKRTFWFATIYFTCGFIAFVGLFIMSNRDERVAADETLQAYKEENMEISQQLKYKYMDSMDFINPAYLQFTKMYEATEENIEIIRDDNSYHLHVVVTWTDSNKNEIKASYYETPLFINRVNISQFIEPPEIKFEQNNLYIQEVEKEVNVTTMNFALEMYDFIVYEGPSNPLEDLIGLRILHLNVPRHFNIIDNSGWID